MKSRRHVLARLSALPLLALLVIGVLRPAPAADYVIQPDDVLSVKIAGEPALSQNYPVDTKGEITMDMAGAIKLSGLTLKEAEAAVKKALSKFIKPDLLQVSIFVVPDAGNGGAGGKVLVFGEVNKPGSVKVKADTRFLDALADAGQPTDKADTRKITLVRRGEKKPQILDLDAVLKDPDLNVVLMPGDTITVPSKVSSGVTVTGEVKDPGTKSLDTVRTAFEAVKAANPTPNADWARISVRSRGTSTAVNLDLRKARNGVEEDDYQLREGDSIFVPSKQSGVAILSGEVQNPGEKDLSGSTNVWDFITKSGGGFTEKANRNRIRISRAGQQDRIVNVAAVAQGLKSADEPEFEIGAGDRVFVPIGTAQILGEVKEPGEKNLGSTTNVLDFVLVQGGGFNDYADRANVTVIRDGKARKVNLTDYAAGLLTPDVPELAIQSGDIVRILRDEKNRFVIVGGVTKPGNYPYVQGMTLIDAIATAGNLTPLAASKIVVARASAFDDQGKLKPIDGAPEAVAPAEVSDSDRNSDGKDEKKRDAKKKRSKKEDDDKLPSNMIEVDLAKFKKLDPKQNVRILPGDRILVPEEFKGNKQSLFDKITRLGGIAAGALFY